MHIISTILRHKEMIAIYNNDNFKIPLILITRRVLIQYRTVKCKLPHLHVDNYRVCNLLGQK